MKINATARHISDTSATCELNPYSIHIRHTKFNYHSPSVIKFISKTPSTYLIILTRLILIIPFMRLSVFLAKNQKKRKKHCYVRPLLLQYSVKFSLALDVWSRLAHDEMPFDYDNGNGGSSGSGGGGATVHPRLGAPLYSREAHSTRPFIIPPVMHQQSSPSPQIPMDIGQLMTAIPF